MKKYCRIYLSFMTFVLEFNVLFVTFMSLIFLSNNCADNIFSLGKTNISPPIKYIANKTFRFKH